MATTTREISVDVSQRNRFAAIVAKQYDQSSRFLKVHILDNGEEMAVDSAAVVTINALRADGKAKSFVGEVNGDGTVTVPLTYWMLELDDTVECDISIIVGSEIVLKTTLFELEVQYAAVSGSEDVTEDENYDVLVQLLEKVAGYSAAEESRVKAEAARVSAEQARVSAETARASAETKRTSAESSRASAETARQSQESTRQTNETARVNAEAARVKAETARASAESSRASAETARTEAETAREEACTQAVADVNTALESVETNILDEDSGTKWHAIITVKNGKPFLTYEEVTTE